MPCHDISPLIVAADLKLTVVLSVQLEKIVTLKQLVIELDKRQASFHPHFIGFEAEHAVD
jgi:hypothetical protein